MVDVAVSPKSSASKSPFGSKLSSPLASSVNNPPSEPAIAVPTLAVPPFTAETVSVSASGSTSLAVRTLPVTTASSEPLRSSSTASGAGLVTVRSKLSVTVPPSPSFAVIVIG